MNLPLPLAVSFPAWTCSRCRQRVEWIDARVIDTPEVFQVIHEACVDDD